MIEILAYVGLTFLFLAVLAIALIWSIGQLDRDL